MRVSYGNSALFFCLDLRCMLNESLLLFHFRLWLKVIYHVMSARVSAIGTGLNLKARYGFLMNNIVEGCVADAIGNEALSGKNSSSFAEQAEIGKATLESGDKTIVKDGKLQS
jgi:hypothetical protein